MSFEILLFLALLVLALLLFAKEVFPLEVSALIILVLLVLTGIITKDEAFSSFSSDAVFLIGSLFVLTAGLNKTGVIKRIERSLLKIAGKSKRLSFFIILVSVALISAFVSNTATLAIVIPVVVSISKSFGDSPRRWLLPVALASVIGGMNTLVGTSTNIIISDLISEYNLEPFELFTTLEAGYPILIVGILYLFFIAPALISDSEGSAAENLEDQDFDLREYSAEFIVQKSSPLANKRIEDSLLSNDADVTIIGVSRDDSDVIIPRSAMTIKVDDRLILEGNIEKLNEIKDKFGLEFLGEAKGYQFLKAAKNSSDSDDIENEKALKLHEVLITRNSRLINRTPVETYLRNRYGISLLAVNRQGVTVHQKLKDFKFSAGDILVVQFIKPIDNRTLDFLGLISLQKLERESYRSKLAPHATIIFIASLLIGSTTTIPLALSCLMGVLAMVALGVLKGNELYDSIEWKVLIFIGAILCLGKGMENSGTAEFIANTLSETLRNSTPEMYVTLFLIVTVVMTQLFSNQATAIILIPLAIRISENAGINPYSLIMAVTLGASFCYVTPLEPVFMMVYGPGRYKFYDFVKTGALFLVIAIAIAVWMIPRVWIP